MAEAVGSASIDTKKRRGKIAAPGFGQTQKNAAVLPRRPVLVRHKKTPRFYRGVFRSTDRNDYFDTAFLKARSIFSLVASQQDWLA
jgi:hypothetical protein